MNSKFKSSHILEVFILPKLHYIFNIHTAIHKQVTNKGSLYGTGTQYSVITNMGKESKKHTTLQINYTPRKKI